MPDLFLQVYGLLTTMRIDGVRVNLISVHYFNVYMTLQMYFSQRRRISHSNSAPYSTVVIIG